VETKTIVKIAGIALGAVATVLLVTQHPVHVGLIALGAIVYFVGDKFID
jgi:hypothetical protein